MLPALVTLLMGVVLGYLAQRSRICFIGGLRDFILVRDTELVKGAIAFFLTAWLAFSAANALRTARPPVADPGCRGGHRRRTRGAWHRRPLS